MMKILEIINGFVWGFPALILILGVGIYLSVATGFAQVVLFPRALRSFFAKLRPIRSEGGAISPFQALCTALAATVGTGNIAGVAGAIAIGGPGAIFWMWICALFGMVTKFAEAALAVHFRTRDENGDLVGGPMYMIRKGMGKRWTWLASVYCLFGVIAAFGMGNATQVNAVVTGINSALGTFGAAETGVGNFLMGIALAALITVLLLGGAKRIGRIAELLVPFAAAAYLLLCLGVLLCNAQAVPGAFRAIVTGAFAPKAITGGMLGSAFTALRVGVSRGVFTNEAGMGTAAIAHAAAQVRHPVEQGLMGIMEVFLDTVVICTMTALVILCSGTDIHYGVDEGAALTTRAFAATYGDWISIPIALFLCCFAFATMLGWGLYGIRCAQYLFGGSAWKPFVLVQAGIVIVSTLLQTGTVWMLSETVNGLMAIPNLLALAALSPVLVRLTKEYKVHYGGDSANGGTYESFDQRKPLRTVTYAQISSPGSGGGEKRKEYLPSEHRSAGYQDTAGVL